MAAVAVALACVAGASAAPLPIHVAFAGHGQYTVDQTYTFQDSILCTLDTHAVSHLAWNTTYDTTAPQGSGSALHANGALAGSLGPWTDDLKPTGRDPNSGDCTVKSDVPQCTGTMFGSDQPPVLTWVRRATDSWDVTVQATPKVDPRASCNGSDANANIVNMDFANLNDAMPDALAAHFAVTDEQIRNGVSKDLGGPFTPVPQDCRAGSNSRSDGSTTSCRQSVSWSGTVKIESKNTCDMSDASAAICIDRQHKDSAASAAGAWKGLVAVQEANCGGPSGSINSDAEVKKACAVTQILITVEKAFAKSDDGIAADPPDPAFQTVASPKPIRHRRARGRGTGSFNKLIANYARAAGLQRAFLTTVERANGAADAGDSAAVRKQNAAGRGYARTIRTLLRGQPALASKAARDLRRAGYRSKKLSKLIAGNGLRVANTATTKALAGF